MDYGSEHRVGKKHVQKNLWNFWMIFIFDFFGEFYKKKSSKKSFLI